MGKQKTGTPQKSIWEIPAVDREAFRNRKVCSTFFFDKFTRHSKTWRICEAPNLRDLAGLWHVMNRLLLLGLPDGFLVGRCCRGH